MKFSKKQIERYSRQIILKKVGVIGQKKLLDASVLIVGAGGLGSPVAIYLAAIGVGTIGIIDNDKVEVSNLSRQIIFSRPKIMKNWRERMCKRLTYDSILFFYHELDLIYSITCLMGNPMIESLSPFTDSKSSKPPASI